MLVCKSKQTDVGSQGKLYKTPSPTLLPPSHPSSNLQDKTSGEKETPMEQLHHVDERLIANAKIQRLGEENQKLLAGNDRLVEEIDRLVAENCRLVEENNRLNGENEGLNRTNAQLAQKMIDLVTGEDGSGCA